MATADKDTIYIDIDDEITGIIDKLKASDGKVVALVLPKRASVFQSIVNMKLLKRAAETSKKNLVLITAETGLLPLAGAAGIHVAKSLTSKPEIPSEPEAVSDEAEVDEDPDVDEVTAKAAGATAIGQLAGKPASPAGAVKPPSDDMETLELDDEDLPPEDNVKTKDFTPPKGKKNKKLHVPNFERFRLLLVLGGLLLVILIGGLIFANYNLAKATISIKTDATAVDANADLNLSIAAQSFDPSGNTTPAKIQTQQKTYTQQVPTTGQKNNGNKASGSVTVTNCGPDDATIPAGIGFKSSSGNTYISQESVDVPTSNFTFGGKCKNDGKASVNVLAQSPGTGFNAPAGGSYTVSYGTGLTGVGDTMAGGTDNIVQSVNQNDINSAKSKITPSDADVKSALESQLQQAGYLPITATYQAGTPAVTQSANVGDTVSTVTVTEVITYSVFGVHKSDLEIIIKNSIKDQIDTSKQTLLDDGLSKAVFNVTNINGNGAALSMSTKTTVGPDLKIDEIKSQAAGQHIGAIKQQLGNNPDVTNVDVKLTPFWVTTVPKQANRITVIIAKPTTTSKPNATSP